MIYDLKSKYSKALVTGGAGFIGSHIVGGLLEEGLEVISVDNYFGGKEDNLKEYHEKYGDKFTEVKCDVTDYDGLKKLFDGVDLVYHEAASKKTICLKDPRMDLLINGTGTFNILELARDFGVKKVVHASSGSVYGEAIIKPQTEDHPVNPTSYYGVSKLAGEKYARAFVDLYDMNVTILRYFHVYGPKQENSDVGGVVSIFGRNVLDNQNPMIHGDGSQERSFTYVGDLVNINKIVAMKEETKGQAYNCASGINITISELAVKVIESFGKENELKADHDDWTIGDIKSFDVSNEKVKALGHTFETSFEDGLAKTLDWLKGYLKK